MRRKTIGKILFLIGISPVLCIIFYCFYKIIEIDPIVALIIGGFVGRIVVGRIGLKLIMD